MSDKSYVTVEQEVCLVCAKKFDTGNLLLDQRLRKQFDRQTVTGWGLCPEHEKLHNEGYIALVGVDESKSNKDYQGNITPKEAYRTGEIAHVRRTVFDKIFGSPAPDVPLVFCEVAVIDHLQKMQEASAAEAQS